MEKKSRARSKMEKPLTTPKINPEVSDITREAWIEEVSNEFVAGGKANKDYYKVILENLWPTNHGIPGPYVSEQQIREAINKFRKEVYKKDDPYLDVFRRVRELQGEEGVTGITKKGKIYQLVDLTLSEKKIPRTGLSKDVWKEVLENHEYKCAICDKGVGEVRLQQDHKIPRSRGGSDLKVNWQPLCDECNIQKSTFCRGCTLDCNYCGWAFPTEYKPIRISPELTKHIRAESTELGMTIETLLKTALDSYSETINKNSYKL